VTRLFDAAVGGCGTAWMRAGIHLVNDPPPFFVFDVVITCEVGVFLLPINRFTLSNGLRVVVAPDDSTPVVAVCVYYDVGYRSEPAERSGFAHVVEHLMFQGSESVPKGEHARQVEAAGGVFHGVTRRDFTVFAEAVPANALKTVLFLEADRMRAPLLGAAELRAQVDVVKEEARSKVSGDPYGRFPAGVSSVLYGTVPNAREWWEFENLDEVTVDECAAFFDTYYSPGNAVLTITGAVTPDYAEQLVRRFFGDIPARAVPPRPGFDEPVPVSVRRRDVVDPRVRQLAVAMGYRMPDPVADTDDYLAYLALAQVLAGGPGARLPRRMMHQDPLVGAVSAAPLDGPFMVRHPDTLSVETYGVSGVTAEQLLDTVDTELRRLAHHPPAEEEIVPSINRWAATMFAQRDDPIGRARGLGLFELLHGQADLLPWMPSRLAAATPERVAAAAEALHPDSRAVLVLSPSGGPA
jgi:zinc protease